jgi:hypothetical protein
VEYKHSCINLQRKIAGSSACRQIVVIFHQSTDIWLPLNRLNNNFSNKQLTHVTYCLLENQIVYYNKQMNPDGKLSRLFKTLIRRAILCPVLFFSLAEAQDLEPRFLSPAPVGMNFVLVSYGYTEGNILFDQSLPLEDVEAVMHSIIPAYARSIDFFGLSGRATVMLPLATCTWRANVFGRDSSTVRNGLMDPMIAFSFNFIGAPALTPAEFARNQSNTIMGFSLKVRPPLGQYNENKFFNLSSGRWQINPRLGLAQTIRRFTIEGYVDAWFFTINHKFYHGNTLEQEPMYALQMHFVYHVKPGFWGSVSYGRIYGGETILNGVAKHNEQDNDRLGATLVYPLGKAQSLKAIFTSGVTTRAGSDFDIFVLAWQYRWGG